MLKLSINNVKSLSTIFLFEISRFAFKIFAIFHDYHTNMYCLPFIYRENARDISEILFLIYGINAFFFSLIEKLKAQGVE